MSADDEFDIYGDTDGFANPVVSLNEPSPWTAWLSTASFDAQEQEEYPINDGSEDQVTPNTSVEIASGRKREREDDEDASADLPPARPDPPTGPRNSTGLPTGPAALSSNGAQNASNINASSGFVGQLNSKEDALYLGELQWVRLVLFLYHFPMLNMILLYLVDYRRRCASSSGKSGCQARIKGRHLFGTQGERQKQRVRWVSRVDYIQSAHGTSQSCFRGVPHS